MFKTKTYRSLILLLFAVMLNSAVAQNINRAEYFFDIDPGVGNGTAITIASTPDSISFTSSISTTGLSGGDHVLFVRTRTTDGIWSLYQPKPFHVKTLITKAEYFFDTDPGLGNGTNIAITPTRDSIDFTSAISTTGLSSGSHALFIRTKDEKGLWSLYQPRDFFVKQMIIGAEYFFDTDPGIGNGTQISITPGLDSVAFTGSIPTTGLADGPHFLFIRTKDEKGYWSLHQPRDIYINTRMGAAEYFIDTDPGLGNGVPISIPAQSGDSVSFNTSIVTGALSNGPHYLFIRTKDSKNIWSLFDAIIFTVDVTLPVEWLNFTVEKKDQSALLNWSTASEINCLKYEIEKTTDENGFSMEKFHTIGSVHGNGTTSSTSNYEYVDNETTYRGIYYYRIKQIDRDGKFSYTKIETIDFSKNIAIKIYPNPGTQLFTLDLSSNDNSDNEVSVFNGTGQLVLSEKNISSPFRFGESLNNGIYFVHVTTNSKTTIFKIIKSN